MSMNRTSGSGRPVLMRREWGGPFAAVERIPCQLGVCGLVPRNEKIDQDEVDFLFSGQALVFPDLCRRSGTFADAHHLPGLPRRVERMGGKVLGGKDQGAMFGVLKFRLVAFLVSQVSAMQRDQSRLEVA